MESAPPRKNSSQKAILQDPAKKRALGAYQDKETRNKTPRWDLVEQYLPLLKSLVGRMSMNFPAHTDIEDIHSIALTGLISASQGFDPQKGTSFGSYATLRIRGALLDELRRMDWMPRTDRAKVKQYKKSVAELEQRLQRPVNEEDICKELNISAKEQAQLQELGSPLFIIPLETTLGNDPEMPSLHETIADVTEMNSRDITENHELMKQIREGLDQLPVIQKKVLVMYYVKGLRLMEIANVLKRSESRICQVHAQAIVSLRKYINKVSSS
tara:strand:- start:82711 stop:83523 length:813 start_codon:yes stop_codon:yes gene_type:complete